MPPRFPRQNQGAVLWQSAHSHPAYAYGAITLYGGTFQTTSASPGRERPTPSNPTSPMGFPTGFGLGSPPFGRPYSGDPNWFLFLPLLGCFRSGGSRSLTLRGAPKSSQRVMGAPTQSVGGRSHSGIPGSTAACAYPGLIAACHALRRLPSRAIHRTASVVRPNGLQVSPRARLSLTSRAIGSGRLNASGRSPRRLHPHPINPVFYGSPRPRALRGPKAPEGPGNGRLFLGWASGLDAFSPYPLGRGCPAMPCRTTGRLEAPGSRSSRTGDPFPSGGQHPRQIESDLSRDGLTPAHVPL